MIRKVLMRGGLSAESTLGDVKRLLRQEFVCMCTDLVTGRPYALSSTQNPEVRVYDAVYASCCIPFVFTPMDMGGAVLSDGCLSSDQPNVFVEEETFFVQLENAFQTEFQLG